MRPAGTFSVTMRIGVAVLDAVRDAHAGEELGQHGRREAGLALVEVAGEELDRQQAAPSQLGQRREQRVAVLAAGEADQPAVAGRDHGVGLDRLAGLAHDALAQLAELGGRRRAGEERVDVVLVEHGQELAGVGAARAIPPESHACNSR